jgi:type IX secretion system substrate protein
MRKIQLLILLSIFSFAAIAQSEGKQKINFEKTDGKIHLKIEKEVDGKTTIIEKTYNSLEEMKNDPELKGMDLHIFDKAGGEMAFFGEEGEEGLHEMKVMVKVDGDSDQTEDGKHTFVFKSDGEETDDLHDINVWIDEDGTKHITKNGEEINLSSGSTWTDKEGNEFTIKNTDGKVMILSDEDLTEFTSEDGKTFEFKFSSDDVEDGDHKVMMYSSSNDDDVKHKTITVEVMARIKIHVEDVQGDEFSKFDGIDAKSLKMDELNYYPNPNSGKFTLQFKADKRPTEIRITSLEGKEIYAESLSGFEGTYQNDIDLSGQKQGIYLLQILQGKKAINKKIVIE